MQYTHDPLGFVLYAFPWGAGELKEFPDGPDEWQHDVLTEISQKLRSGELSGHEDAIQMAVASGHGIGKSALVSWVILWAMATFPDCRGVVTANTENQLKTKTWAELAKWKRLMICEKWFELTATALYSRDPKHEKTWRIDMIPWSEKNTEAFAGLHNVGKRILLIFDEASAIFDKIWEVAEGALTDRNTEIIWLAFGNPTMATGRFRECFRKYRKRWSCRNIDARDVKITNKKALQKIIDDYGVDSDVAKVRVRGMFPSTSIRQFISQVDIDAGYGRFLRREQYEFAPVILTLDNAWEGDDDLVILKRQGLRAEVLFSANKNDNDVWVANKLMQLEDEHGADAVFVDGGYGTGVVSVGRTAGRNWTIVWFNEAPADSGYLNKRAEMFGGIQRWLKEGGSFDSQDKVLYDELSIIQTVPRMDGKIQLMSKADIKKVLNMPSPNRADALALSFAHPVTSIRRRMVGGYEVRQAYNSPQNITRDYDPFAPKSPIQVVSSVREYKPY